MEGREGALEWSTTAGNGRCILAAAITAECAGGHGAGGVSTVDTVIAIELSKLVHGFLEVVLELFHAEMAHFPRAVRRLQLLLGVLQPHL